MGSYTETVREMVPAMYWLASTSNPHPFASNAFSRRDAANLFQEITGKYGAKAYIVTLMEEDGEPYADELYVSYDYVRVRAMADCHAYIMERHNPDEHSIPFHQNRALYRYWWD